MARLYKFIEDNFGVMGQSALARKMKVSPQRINNWEDESRGISESGALSAQLLFGCDANWLLQGSISVYPLQQSNGPLIASDYTGSAPWPFWSISPKDWELLTPEERRHFEEGVVIAIKNRGQPEKQNAPAIKIANG